MFSALALAQHRSRRWDGPNVITLSGEAWPGICATDKATSFLGNGAAMAGLTAMQCQEHRGGILGIACR